MKAARQSNLQPNRGFHVARLTAAVVLALSVLAVGCSPSQTPPTARVERVGPGRINLSTEENVLPASRAVSYVSSQTVGVAPGSFVIDDFDILWFLRPVTKGLSQRLDHTLLAYDTRTGSLREFKLPFGGGFRSSGAIVDDHRGNLWIGALGAVIRFDKATQAATTFALPRSIFQSVASRARVSGSSRSVGDFITGIVVDELGRVWMARRDVPALTGFDPKMKRFVQTRLPEGAGVPRRLVTNSRGALLWVAAGPSTKSTEKVTSVLRFDTATAVFKGLGVASDAIGAEPQGNLLYAAGSSGQLREQNGRTLVSQVVGRAGGILLVENVFVGRSGTVWLVVPGGVKRISPRSEIIDSVIVGPPLRPRDLRRPGRRLGKGRYLFGVAEDSAGGLWFSDLEANRLGVVRIP